MDPQLLAVSPGHFAEHLQVLSERWQPFRLREWHDIVSAKRLTARPVAITFDDGYADNLREAMPVLRTWGIPATFFVVSGQVGRDDEFWWDEVERILLRGRVLPRVLEVSAGDQEYRWELGSGSGGDDPDWNVESQQAPSPRQAAYRELCELLRPLSVSVRDSILAQLRTWAGESPTGRPTHRALTADEVVALTSDELAEVGAHTVNHPVLSVQPHGVQKQEIQESKRQLEDLVGGPVRAFAYPFGGRADYSPQTTRLVRDAGFTLACSNFPGTVSRGTRALEIPRIVVRDWSGDEFERRLDEQFRQ
jgi:peptidoglycan/xylan/chitin deacetylase (PgdA/CDA1 family)